MGSPDASELFDTSAALAVLDRIVDREEKVVLHTAASAWEAAWIACLTDSSAWRSVAQNEFAHVVVELHGVLWTVDKLKSRATHLGPAANAGRLKTSRPVAVGPVGAAQPASVASLEPSPQ